MTDLIQQLNDALANRIDHVHESLVQISNGQGAGAGTIWHSDGLIITNAHVIRGHNNLNVTLSDGRTFPASIIAADDRLDLAALSINATNLPTIQTGDSHKLKAGQWVMAIGHPWGVQGAVTSGVIIGVGDQLPEMGQIQPGREWIALSLHMRPGHSGGPVVDSDGRLIGINTMITGPDVGIAIPAHIVKAFLKDAIGAKVTATL